MANEVSGQDLDWFFDQVLPRLGRVRLRACSELVSSEKTVRGLVDRDGTRVAVGGEPLGARLRDERRRAARRRGHASRWTCWSRFEDGSTARERWDGARSLEAVPLRTRGARRLGRGRSRARAAARRERHQQQPHARAAGRGRGRPSGRCAGWCGCRTCCSPTGSSCDGRAPRRVDAYRDGLRRVRRRAVDLARRLGRHAAALALPLVARAARHDRRAPRRQPRGRARPPRRELGLVAGVPRAGHRARDDLHAVDPRLRRGAAQPQRPRRQRAPAHRDRGRRRRLAGGLVVPLGRHPRSLRAQSPRRARPAFFAACGTHFWRLLRLGAHRARLLYAVLFAWRAPVAVRRRALRDGSRATYDVERRPSPSAPLLYAVFAAAARRP